MRAVVLLILLPALLAAESGQDSATTSKVDVYLKQLGDPDPAVRIAADRRLSDMGAAVQPALVSALIDNLSNPDPGVRATAARQLADLGDSIRPRLMAMLETSAAETRAQISRILLNRAWTDARDPAAVQEALGDYSQLDSAARSQQVQNLFQLPDPEAQDKLIQILQFDPSAAVRWQAASVLRSQLGNRKPPLENLRALSLDEKTDANVPLLAAVGWAWHEADARRTTVLLSRAVALDAAHRAAAHGELDFAYQWLIDLAQDHEQYSQALSLLRQQAGQSDWQEDPVPAPIGNLFALQAEHGPFPQFAADLNAYRSYLGRSEILYTFGRLLNRWGWAPVGCAVNMAALAAGGLSAARHNQVAAFLADHEWLEASQRESNLALFLCRDSDSTDLINAYFQLARVASERNDDLEVARDEEIAVEHLSDSAHELMRTTPFGDVQPWSDQDARADIEWHYLRAARSVGDAAGMQTHLQKLVDLDKLGQIFEKDPGLATDIVPALQEAGRTSEADRCFDAAYKDLSADLAADPTDAESKNNLAWLCACCGRNLDEAIKLADQAVAAAPSDSAFLDTDAEAHFRAGQRDRAVELETHALQLKPGDAFMQSQLQEFQGKTDAHVSTRP